MSSVKSRQQSGDLFMLNSNHFLLLAAPFSPLCWVLSGDGAGDCDPAAWPLWWPSTHHSAEAAHTFLDNGTTVAVSPLAATRRMLSWVVQSVWDVPRHHPPCILPSLICHQEFILHIRKISREDPTRIGNISPSTQPQIKLWTLWCWARLVWPRRHSLDSDTRGTSLKLAGLLIILRWPASE